ncbi:hypothetical protein ACFQJ8_25495 [Halocatena marina]|uniref:hypothetical protein n=1 Tax=Halocatena marina TaxID=2934937 RepID=UPI0036095D08
MSPDHASDEKGKMNYTHNRSDDESGTTARSGRDLLRLNRRDYLAATGGLAGFVGLGSGITAASSSNTMEILRLIAILQKRLETQMLTSGQNSVGGGLQEM